MVTTNDPVSGTALAELDELAQRYGVTVIQKGETPVCALTGAMVRAVDAFVISDTTTYEQAAAELALIKGWCDKLDAHVEALKRPHLDKLKEIRAEWGSAEGDFDSAEKLIKAKLVAFDVAQRKAREEAMRQAEMVAALERKKVEQAAARAEKRGNEIRAEELRNQAQMVVPIVPIVETPKVDTLHYVEKWYAEVVDSTLVPVEYKVVDLAMLQKLATATRGALKVPGVRFYSERIAASKSK